jgi:hypothetical protein
MPSVRNVAPATKATMEAIARRDPSQSLPGTIARGEKYSRQPGATTRKNRDEYVSPLSIQAHELRCNGTCANVQRHERLGHANFVVWLAKRFAQIGHDDKC